MFWAFWWTNDKRDCLFLKKVEVNNCIYSKYDRMCSIVQYFWFVTYMEFNVWSATSSSLNKRLNTWKTIIYFMYDFATFMALTMLSQKLIWACAIYNFSINFWTMSSGLLCFGWCLVIVLQLWFVLPFLCLVIALYLSG